MSGGHFGHQHYLLRDMADLRAENAALRDRLAAIEAQAEDATEYVLAIQNRELRARLAAMQADHQDGPCTVENCYRCRAEKAEAALAAAEKRVEPDSCEWDFDDCGTWNTTCGNAFQFTEGGPTENGCKFCPYCGHALKEIPAKFDEWGDLICDTVCTVCDGAGCPDCCQECEGKGCAKCEKERAR